MRPDRRRSRVVRAFAMATLMTLVLASSADRRPAWAQDRSTTDAAAARSVSDQWAKAWTAKDLDAVLALYADDAVFLPSTGSRITGRGAIRDLFAKALAAHDPNIRVHSTKTEISGDQAYDIGEYEETLVSNGVTRVGRGSFLAVLKRDRALGWLIVAQMWTDEPAANH